jgi:putative ABC transport system ATP-binding protein
MSKLIDVSNVGKIYGDENVPTIALNKVSFSIKEGEFVSIMGPSGSGKSTLLHILGFLERPSHGTYKFLGKKMDEYSDDELAHIRNSKMGFVFQAFNLLARTSVLNNVMLPLAYSDIPESNWNNLARRAIKSVGLSNREQHEPSQLSGGEKQRAAIARALVNNPDIIFADEPTGNLDSKSGGIIMDIIKDLNDKQNQTIVLITHETYAASYAKRLILLRDGNIEKDESVSKRHTKNDGYKK